MMDNKTIRKVIMLNKLLPSGSPTYEDREASGAVANFTTNVVKPFVSLDCEIFPIQEGTGTPSPSNPRPISGTSVLNVTRTGKNLFDSNNITPNSYINSDGTQVTGTAASGWSSSDFIAVKGGVNYYFQPNSTAGGTAKGCYYDSEKNFISYFNSGAIATTSPSNACFACFSFRSASTDIQLELGTTATTYEPYNAETYTIDLGQEILGGSADCVGGSGESEWGYIASYNGETITEPWLSSIDAYAEGTLPSIGAEVVYKLATPSSFTFTGQPIDSLLGVNNVWTDSGNTKVTYKYKTGEGGSTKKKYLPIFYDFYRKEKQP